MSFPKWLCLSLLITFPLCANATPTADEIVAGVVARNKVQVQNRKSLDFNLDIIREKMDDKHQVTQTLTEQMVIKGDKTPSYHTRSESTDPEDEAKKASREEPFELLNIISHYTYTLEGIEMADGVECYKIAFTPKPNLTYNNREEKVLNSVSGHLWASTKDYSLIKDQGSLMHPVSVAWVFATLKEMEFTYDSMLLPNGDYGPKQVQYRYLVSIPFTYLHERDTRKMSSYRSSGSDSKN